MPRRKRSAKRDRDETGQVLATAAELAHVRRIARFRHFTLPDAWAANLAFVRAFLDAFAYQRNDQTERARVVRLLNSACALIEAELDERELCRKLAVDDCLALLLADYAHRHVSGRRDRSPSEDDVVAPQDDLPTAPAKTDLETLNEAFHDGDDAVWAHLET